MSFRFPMSGPKIEFLLSPSRQNWSRNLPLKCRFMRTDDVFDVRKANYRWQKDRFMAGCLEWNTLPPFIICLVFNNKLWNYSSKNHFQFQNSQIKNTTGLHIFIWIGWFHLVLLNLMKSIPKVCQTSETLKIFCNQASVTFLISCR